MSTRIGPFFASCVAFGCCLVTVTTPVLAQSAVEGHVSAAQAAAGVHHTRLVDYLCPAPPSAPGGRSGGRAGGGATVVPVIPGMPDWYAEPAKVFDNLFFLGTRSLNSYAVVTSDGIVIIDPLYDYNAELEIVDGLTKLGLDPATITHVIVSHGHGDHYGGARLLQERYGATVLLSAADWDLVLAGSGSQPKPERDGVITDGQTLVVGDTRFTFTLTPGHTPGTFSTLVPVRDGDEDHIAALWGGTAMRRTAEFYRTYIASAQKFAAVVDAAGADAVLGNHAIFDDAHRKIAALATRESGDPHPYVLGAAATLDYMRVVEHCALAAQASLGG